MLPSGRTIIGKMRSFFRLFALAWLGLALMACSGAGLTAGLGSRTFSIPESRLQDAVGKRFPREQRLADIVDLRLSSPRLGLLPAANRLSTSVDLTLTERLMQGTYQGQIAMDYGLRFEPSDKTVRMTGVRVSKLSLGEIPEPYRGALARYAPRLAERLFDEYVLHRFTDLDLSLVNGLGFEPGEIKVTASGLDVTLQPIGARPPAAQP